MRDREMKLTMGVKSVRDSYPSFLFGLGLSLGCSVGFLGFLGNPVIQIPSGLLPAVNYN